VVFCIDITKKITSISTFHCYDVGFCEGFVFEAVLIPDICEGPVITPNNREILKLVRNTLKTIEWYT
jgi:hypothetical protein